MAAADRHGARTGFRLPATLAAVFLLSLGQAACGRASDRPDPGNLDTASPPDSAAPAHADTSEDAAAAAPADSSAKSDSARAAARTLRAKLDQVSDRVDSVDGHVRAVQRRTDGLSRALADLRRDLRARGIFGTLMFLLGALVGGLGLPRLREWRRSSRPAPPSTYEPATPTRGQARRAELDTQRQAQDVGERLDTLEDRVRQFEASAASTLRSISRDLGVLLEERLPRPRPPDGRPSPTSYRDDRTDDARHGMVLHDPRPDMVLHDSDTRDLPRHARDRDARERLPVLLNEEGIFVPYREHVSKPMAEIVWRPGEAQADGYILTSFLFSLDSRRLQIAFDVDLIDSGRYETVRPARVDWSEGSSRGRVLEKGQLRYVGT
ncbi:MAG TPA: hypothetical protein VFJ82_20935 [Longimicrobium sp.]|nr:hypothetical protein [Longimicrobium sp.]